jgi:threonine/homoserine/homoserine lactone efflux protein
MQNHVFFLAGAFVGLSIAAPIGPMGLLCIQRTLASGMRVGVSTGLGAATVNVVYGAIVLFGMGQLAPWMTSFSRVLSALGGAFLLWSALRTFQRNRKAHSPAVGTVALSPLTAYGSAVAFNATNPMSLILIMALLTPVIGRSAPPVADALLLLGGMFAAAASWWVCLTGSVALLRTRLTPALLAHVNRAAGVVLTIYGALALARSARM